MNPAATPFMPAAPPAASVRIATAEAALFASDMHLDDARPDLTRHFLDQLDTSLTAASATVTSVSNKSVSTRSVHHEARTLFLLGDLFEFWIGDDHFPPAAQALAARLAAFSSDGGRVFLMHGNRDFLLDVPLPSDPDTLRFSTRCGAVLLPDPAVIEVAGRRIGLSHGDALCTDDTRYQQWRALCRSTTWQQQFLRRTAAERLAMALSMRKQSTQAQAVTETLSDVNQAALDDLMTRLDTDLLIHGHTHQPKFHLWQGPDGVGLRKRWVLSDWEVAPRRGAVMSIAAAAAASGSSVR